MLLWTFTHTFLDRHMFSILLKLGLELLRVELLGHMVTPCLTFWKTAMLFSKVAAPFSLPATYEGSNFFTSWMLVIIHLFDYGHPGGCELMSHCGFWFAFPWWLVMLSIFLCAHWLFVCFLLKVDTFEKCIFKSFNIWLKIQLKRKKSSFTQNSYDVLSVVLCRAPWDLHRDWWEMIGYALSMLTSCSDPTQARPIQSHVSALLVSVGRAQCSELPTPSSFVQWEVFVGSITQKR